MNAMKEKASHLPGADKLSGVIGQTGLGKFFPMGGGNRQSPIDILTSEARFDENLGDGSFQFNYVNTDCLSLANTGVSWQIACKPDAASTLTAVHLPDTYRLHNIHCHWGLEPMNGSEHLVGGVGYAGEIHIVHWNTKYASYDDAAKQADGLAVLAIFLNVTKHYQTLLPSVTRGDRISCYVPRANCDFCFPPTASVASGTLPHPAPA